MQKIRPDSRRLQPGTPKTYNSSPSGASISDGGHVSYLREVQLDDNFGPFVAFQENFAFIPKLFRAQTLLPRVIEVLSLPRTPTTL